MAVARGALPPLPADAALLADAASLNSLDGAAFEELVDIIYAAWPSGGAEPSAESTMSALEEWAGKSGVKAKALRASARVLMLVLAGAVRSTSSPAALRDDMDRLGFAAEKVDVFCSKWSTMCAHFFAQAAALPRPAAAFPLVDAEWRFGVTTATDELARVGSTFVQLKLSVLNGSALQDEHVELSLSQFYELLAQLERARSYMDFIGSSS